MGKPNESIGLLDVEEKLRVRKMSVGGDPRNESDGNDSGKLVVDGVVFTIGTEATNAINVGIQLQAGGADIDHSAVVMAYLSDDSAGVGISGTAPATSVAIGTDGSILKELTTKLMWILDSETDGDIDLTITETGGDTWYLVVVDGYGNKHVSDAITFAS